MCVCVCAFHLHYKYIVAVYSHIATSQRVAITNWVKIFHLALNWSVLGIFHCFRSLRCYCMKIFSARVEFIMSLIKLILSEIHYPLNFLIHFRLNCDVFYMRMQPFTSKNKLTVSWYMRRRNIDTFSWIIESPFEIYNNKMFSCEQIIE